MRLLADGPPRLAADLVTQGHAGAGIDQEDDRRGLPLLFLEHHRGPQGSQQAEEKRQQAQAEGQPAPAPARAAELARVGPEGQHQDHEPRRRPGAARGRSG